MSPVRPMPAARVVSLSICVMALAALGYAWLAPLDIVVSAQGRVIPSGRSKVVQPLEAGIVRAIAVRDGQMVKAGDVLIELDSTASTADRDRLQQDLWTTQAEMARHEALLFATPRATSGATPGPASRTPAAAAPALTLPEGVPPAIARQQGSLLEHQHSELLTRLGVLDADIARRTAERDTLQTSLDQARASLPLVQQKLQMREGLAATGYLSRAGVLDAQLELMNLQRDLAVQAQRLLEARTALDAGRQQRAQMLAEHRARASAALSEASRRADATRLELLKAVQRRELQTIRSPIDGVIQQLTVSTVGGVVTPAQALMTIVPAGSRLEVEAQVMNRDIGHVRAGQRVINKVETFDFTRYGFIEGTVSWVGTDAITDPRLGPVYPVRVELDSGQTPRAVNGRAGDISAGMSMTVEVKTGQRRMLEYLIAPLLRHGQEAIRER